MSLAGPRDGRISLRRAARRAWDAATDMDADATVRALMDIDARFGPDGTAMAMLAWIDALLAAHPRASEADGVAFVETDDPWRVARLMVRRPRANTK